MIVRDEEAVLGRLLADAAGFADEVIVVDTGSEDGTVQVARAAGAHVLHYPWSDDFAAARNVSFSAGTTDWVMWLDADDRVPLEVQHRLQAWKTDFLPKVQGDAILLPYRAAWAADGVTCLHSYHRERLLRRQAGPRWIGRVHEVAEVPGAAVLREDCWVEHRPPPDAKPGKSDRNLRILLASYDAGEGGLRTLFYLGNELRDHGRTAEALERYGDYLAQAAPGWERYQALVYAARCASVLERPEFAQALAEEAVRLDPSRAEAWVLQGMWRFHREDWAGAIPYFTAATALSVPRMGFVELPAYSYVPWDCLSVCLQRLGRNAEALQALSHAISGNPDRDRLADNAGWMIRDGQPPTG